MKTRRHPFRLGLCTAALVLTWLIAPGDAGAQDAEERIRRLEEQLRAITQELQELKANLQQPPTALEPEAGSVQDVEVRKAGAEAAPSEAAALEERVQTLEQRVDQQGIRAHLGDGLILEDPDQRWRLRMTGRALGDYRSFAPDEVASDTFSIRQARLGVNVQVLRDWSIYVEGEYASTAASQNAFLTNAYVDWQVMGPRFTLRLGQFKPQFGLEHTDRVPYFDFMERALPASLIQNFLFDRGLMAFGSPLPGFYYGVSITNGTGQNIDERQTNATETEQDGKDFTARFALNLAQAMRWPDAIVHAGVSHKQGTQANTTSTPYSAATLITEGRGVTFFTPQAFNTTTGPSQVSEIDRRLQGLEGILAYGPVKLAGEIITARYSGTRLAAPLGGFERDMSGYYLSAMWLVTGEHYADAYKGSFVTRIKPRNNFSWKDGTWGAWEVGLRYSSVDASDFKAANPAFTGRPSTSTTALVTSQSTGAHAYTLGLKWMPNTYVRLMLNYVRTEFDDDIVIGGKSISHENALNLRAQFDFF